jgi:hypothetical protein
LILRWSNSLRGDLDNEIKIKPNEYREMQGLCLLGAAHLLLGVAIYVAQHLHVRSCYSLALLWLVFLVPSALFLGWNIVKLLYLQQDDDAPKKLYCSIVALTETMNAGLPWLVFMRLGFCITVALTTAAVFTHSDTPSQCRVTDASDFNASSPNCTDSNYLRAAQFIRTLEFNNTNPNGKTDVSDLAKPDVEKLLRGKLAFEDVKTAAEANEGGSQRSQHPLCDSIMTRTAEEFRSTAM